MNACRWPLMGCFPLQIMRCLLDQSIRDAKNCYLPATRGSSVAGRIFGFPPPQFHPPSPTSSTKFSVSPSLSGFLHCNRSSVVLYNSVLATESPTRVNATRMNASEPQQFSPTANLPLHDLRRDGGGGASSEKRCGASL